MTDEKMDVPQVLEKLQEALSRQYRSALQYCLVAGSVLGPPHQFMSRELWGFAEHELADARRLVEKITALGGRPTTDVKPIRDEEGFTDAMRWLIQTETEAIESLGAVIPPSGQEGRSEALEHLMEHIILRKQEQVDLLIRTMGGPNGDG